MQKRSIFLIDDHKLTLENSRLILQDVLNDLGLEFFIETFPDSSEARERWQTLKPELVILDLSMPAPDGMEMLRWWQQIRDLHDCRVIISSRLIERKEEIENQNFTFWQKTLDINETASRYRLVLNELPAYRTPYSEHLVRLQVAPGAQTRIDVVGNHATNDSSNYPLPATFAGMKDDIDRFFHPRISFRSLYERGFLLHQHLFADPIGAVYREARGAAGSFDNLRLRFHTLVSETDSGFELLYDRPSPGLNGEFLALRHPLATQILGQQALFTATNRHGLNEIKKRGRKLRFLLVAAHLEGSLLPRLEADAEIDALASGLPALFRKSGIQTEVEVIHSRDADVETLHAIAQRKQFDVLHFAGHATVEDLTRHQPPGLYLWTRKNRNNEEHLLTVTELEDLVSQMNVSFVYLNCCRGGAQRDYSYAIHSRVSGITHAILKAGVSQVLCYRTSVDDASARSFALSFYKNFAQTGEPDAALRLTRRPVYDDFERNQTESIWLSAMLFDQSPIYRQSHLSRAAVELPWTP